MKRKMFIFMILIISSFFFSDRVFAMQIFITNEEENYISIEAELTDTVLEVKSAIENKNGIPASNQILIFEKNILKDNNTLQDYNIKEDSTLQLQINTYKKYEIGDVVYFNPITAKICESNEINCMKWNVFSGGSEYDKTMVLISQESLGETGISAKEEKIVTGCFIDGKYHSEYDKSNYEMQKEKWSYFGVEVEWRENVTIESYENVNQLLAFLREKTNNWNDKLILSNGDKARLFTSNEMYTVWDADNIGNGYSIYDFLKTGNTYIGNYPCVLTYVGYYSNGRNILGVTSINYRTSAQVYPIIEINKEYLETYNVLSKETVHGTFEVDSFSNNVGDEVLINTNPNIGYQLDKIKVTNADGDNIYVVNNEFIMPRSDVSVEVTFKEKEYSFIKGDNTEFIKNQTNNYSFETDGDYSIFKNLTIGTLELVKDDDYVVTEGSTIIIFNESGINKLNTLSDGNYIVTVSYANGKNATGNLIIKSQEKNNEDKSCENNKSEITENEKNPQTSDDIIKWCAIGLISALEITVAIVYRRKYLIKSL